VGSEEKLTLLSLYVMIYGDVSLRDIMRKYYGKSLKVLKCIPYSFMTSTSRKRRKICKGGIYDRIVLYTLYFVRGIPFLLGEILKR
jgi:hypothetical protein